MESRRRGEERDAGREQRADPAQAVDTRKEGKRGNADQDGNEHVLELHRRGVDPIVRCGKAGCDHGGQRDMECIASWPEHRPEHDHHPDDGNGQGLTEHESREQRDRDGSLDDTIGAHVDG